MRPYAFGKCDCGLNTHKKEAPNTSFSSCSSSSLEDESGSAETTLLTETLHSTDSFTWNTKYFIWKHIL